MVYEIPDYKKSIKQNVFEFKIGEEFFEATRFDLLPTSFIEQVGDIEPKHVIKAMRLALAGDNEELADALGELPMKAITDLIAEWQKSSGVSLGESEASAS